MYSYYFPLKTTFIIYIIGILHKYIIYCEYESLICEQRKKTNQKKKTSSIYNFLHSGSVLSKHLSCIELFIFYVDKKGKNTARWF